LQRSACSQAQVNFGELVVSWKSLEPDCHEIVMVARSERIISEQNGSNRSSCNTLKRGIE
jgi:hypothetical protein